MIRVSVDNRIEWSSTAAERLEKFKDFVKADNHIEDPIHRTPQKDTNHEFTISEQIPGAASAKNLLIAHQEIPWYATPSQYLLYSLCGLSWFARQQFMSNSSFAKYEVVKSIIN
jgi:hypothetical protein